MKRPLLTIVAAIFLIGIRPANAQTWNTLGHYGKKGNEYTEYLSSKKTIIRGGYIQAWQLNDYQTTQKRVNREILKSIPPKDNQYLIDLMDDKPSIYISQYKSLLILLVVDCVERKLANTEFYSYSGAMGSGQIVEQEKEEPDFSHVLPGSQGEYMLDMICKPANPSHTNKKREH